MCAKITNFLNIHYGIKFNIIKEAAWLSFVLIKWLKYWEFIEIL
jgi:hypothetical protein